LKLFETKAEAAGLCRQDMNRLYKKPTVNPAFKLRQTLPPLPVVVSGKSMDRLAYSATESNRPAAPSTHEPPHGGLIPLCKNFAFSNLF
jgi:hypothetical protein